MYSSCSNISIYILNCNANSVVHLNSVSMQIRLPVVVKIGST